MNQPVPPFCTDDAAQEAAEVYVLKRLSASDCERYEEHLLVCPRCQDAVAEFDVFLFTARVVLANPPAERKRRRTSRPKAKTANC